MPSNASILPLLNQVAPRLARHFFGVHKCPHSSPSTASRSLRCLSSNARQFKSIRQTAFLKAFRSQSTVAPSARAWASPAMAEAVERTASLGSKGFPKVCSRAVGWWLVGGAASVYAIVVLGGLTRLTESGLSITEWRPVTGTFPPLSMVQWDTEFTKYKDSPEFKQLNPYMDLAEFKKIYWMEYAHRLLGRGIGLGILLPSIYLIARKKVSLPVARNLILINALIGTQGFVGWWMVKSGLKDDLFATGSHPRVSQYRLAVHLGLAFTVYSSLLWNGLSILRERRLTLFVPASRAAHLLSRLGGRNLSLLRKSTAALAALVFTTVISGALVAGLDAGLIYNEFPYMGLGLTPPSSELWSSFYSRQPPPHNDLYWRNMCENPSLVQLDHRILATSTFTAANALYLYARFTPSVRAALPRGARQALAAAAGMVWIQATLGITTLLYLVPTSLAAAHQAGSLALLTFVIVLGNRVWTPPRLARLVAQRTKEIRVRQSGGVMKELKGRMRSVKSGDV